MTAIRDRSPPELRSASVRRTRSASHGSGSHTSGAAKASDGIRECRRASDSSHCSGASSFHTWVR